MEAEYSRSAWAYRIFRISLLTTGVLLLLHVASLWPPWGHALVYQISRAGILVSVALSWEWWIASKCRAYENTTVNDQAARFKQVGLRVFLDKETLIVGCLFIYQLYWFVAPTTPALPLGAWIVPPDQYMDSLLNWLRGDTIAAALFMGLTARKVQQAWNLSWPGKKRTTS